jgi:protoheme IX farnesyltransferase
MPTTLYPYLPVDTPASNSSQASVQDFLALLKPGVMSLVVYTGLIGILLASQITHPFLVCIVILSIALGSGSAAAFNMWYDRDIDALMERTQKRPIPLGKIAPHDALGFAISLSITAIVLMAFASNYIAASMLAFSIFFYDVIYTIFLKRKTAQNIVIGGAAGAFPPLIGWYAMTGSISLEPIILFLLIFLWTPSHFWSLAILRAQEYQAAGVPMLPVTKGINVTKKQILIYTIALIAASWLPVMIKMNSWIYALSASTLDVLYLYYALRLFLKPTNSACKSLFLYSIFYLFALFTAIILDFYMLGF